MKRNPAFPVKGLKRGGFLKFSGNTKRGRENRGCFLVKKLLVQEYHEALAIDKEILKSWDLEHIWGKNWPGFELGATLDLLNLQLVPRAQHELKTNATAKTTEETGITKRFDFRGTVVMARLVAMRDRILAKKKIAGGVWTLKEQLKAYRQELLKGGLRP